VISLSSWLVSGRANFEPYGIAPIGLSFARPEQEAEYQTFILKVTVAHIRFSLAMAMMIILLYGTLDPFIYQERGVLVYALLVRVLVVFPAALLLFLTTFHSRYPAYARLAGTCAICAVGAGFCLITHRSLFACRVDHRYTAGNGNCRGHYHGHHFFNVSNGCLSKGTDLPATVHQRSERAGGYISATPE
jgi:hypothetical protein